ncbi:HD-GYP domain-containing protein [Bermanella marisrubri]|uniref:HD-GYP domain-containing protein n=1 Tax=Bermanella marisrubri TaxID=207949 RepID=Q1N0R9_9GAMM|nr:HD-GYP domain-containing protein [Bermanella marisrubri]EAT11764.1 hypothetical protein RED65_05239 [Oceanobacter sp. RED65] [Bermanella marisrubri]QIZ83799.1 HD-GYP domain-containing protein [Bermanella marisrubri]
MLKKIDIQHLKPGMYVANITQTGVSLHAHEREGRIKDEKTIESLRKRGIRSVYIDDEQGLDSDQAKPIAEVDRKMEQAIKAIVPESPQVAKVSFEQEFEKADKLHHQALDLVENAMALAKAGKTVEVGPFEDTANNFIDSITRNQNALACLTRIRDKDSYLMEHSVNVAVLMGILGRHLKLQPQYLHECVTGALLHDIGKILIPDSVLHKPGKLTEDEFTIMKRHASLSRQILQESQEFPEVCVNIAGQHHERMDGNGYPDGLSGEQISPEGRMASVVDVYDAITANRVYHKGLTPSSGFKRLLKWAGPHLDTQYVHGFIKAMGIYPIGSLVELNNGLLAIVQEETDTSMKPVVRTLYDTNRRDYCKQRRIDLSQAQEYSIKQVVDPNSYGIDLTSFLKRPIY